MEMYEWRGNAPECATLYHWILQYLSSDVYLARKGFVYEMKYAPITGPLFYYSCKVWQGGDHYKM